MLRSRCIISLLLSKSFNRKCSTFLAKTDRNIIKISGTDTSTFLQGLITNDINLLENDSDCIFSAFLNNKGRVLCDTLIFKTSEQSSYFIDCDSRITETLCKHLRIFKVKRKIDIEVNSQLHCFAAVGVDLSNMTDFTFFKDPRVNELGYRIIVPSSKMSSVEKLGIEIKVESEYKKLRYTLGIGEGVAEIPPGSSFPLEMNIDLLNGVSFNKGCYLGQELTARTYHTGIIRKRLLPLNFEKPLDVTFNNVEINNTDDSKSVGKLRGFYKNVGIGLMRIKETFTAKELVIDGIKLDANIPKWWPELRKGSTTVE